MNGWNKITLKTTNATVEEMVTSKGNHYYTQSMLEETIGTIPQSIEDGRGVFTDNKNIISFENGLLKSEDKTENINLNSLTITGDTVGNGMFENSSIKSFVGDLLSLKNGKNMFRNSDIQNFVSYTAVLKDGLSMFSDCENLTEFCGDLSSLKNGDSMFYGCPNLIIDSVDLSSLESGEDMFYGCHLGENVVRDIVKTFGDSDVHLTTSEMPRIDMGVTADGLQSFYNETGLISFSDSCHVYNGKIFYIYPDENVNSWEDLEFGVIEYSDEDGSIVNITYPDNFWEEAEDISGLFIGDTKLTSFEDICGKRDLPSVKYAKGTFYGNTSLKRFTTKMTNLKKAMHMFYGCSALETVNVSFKNCEELQSAFHSCSALTTFEGDLSNLKIGYYCFYNCSLVNFFTPSLEKLENGMYMFYNNGIINFSYDMPKLEIGSRMFRGCSSLTSFDGDLSSLNDGSGMFYNCVSITSFNTPHLNSLTVGDSMFYNTKITDFDIETRSLKTAINMFSYNVTITKYESDTPLLKNAQDMFYGCTGLNNVIMNTPLLEIADKMFSGCTSLENVDIDISSLKNGRGMFEQCKLNGESVKKIYEKLPQVPKNYSFSGDGVGNISIGINSTYSSTASTNKSRLNTFAVAAGFENWQAMKDAFVSKGWEVYWYYASSTKLIEV